MTYDLNIVNREALGLKPRDEMTADDWRILWDRAEKQSPGKACQWEVTGSWGCGWGWVGTITDFCAPILDGPELNMRSLRGLSEAEFDAALKAQSDKPHCVPLRKFGSNDAWWFSPQECRDLAYMLHAAPHPDLRDLGRFFDFAAKHGGCEAS